MKGHWQCWPADQGDWCCPLCSTSHRQTPTNQSAGSWSYLYCTVQDHSHTVLYTAYWLTFQFYFIYFLLFIIFDINHTVELTRPVPVKFESDSSCWLECSPSQYEWNELWMWSDSDFLWCWLEWSQTASTSIYTLEVEK